MSTEPRKHGPITAGHQKKGVDWNELKQRMSATLGYIPSLSQRLSRDELAKLGFVVAATSYDT